MSVIVMKRGKISFAVWEKYEKVNRPDHKPRQRKFGGFTTGVLCLLRISKKLNKRKNRLRIVCCRNNVFLTFATYLIIALYVLYIL